MNYKYDCKPSETTQTHNEHHKFDKRNNSYDLGLNNLISKP